MKYWKTTVNAVVLTAGDTPPDFQTLAEIHYEATEGDASCAWDDVVEEVTKDEMIALLEEQGSAPEFLIQDDDE